MTKKKQLFDIGENFLKNFSNYLFNRKQNVKFIGASSEISEITSGVCQVSRLGPFFIY